MSKQDTTQITFVFKPHVEIKPTDYGDLLLIATNSRGMKNMFTITDGDLASYTDNSVTMKPRVTINGAKTEASDLLHFESKLGPGLLPKNFITEIREG
tara:strand:+ start:196 stop:489 length:294 start_codon:yes stop_codon:yes gene_type:complete